MNGVAFYIFFGLNWVITLLPLKILYLFSDLLYFVLYYIVSYRRKVVEINLKNSFPEKSDEERRLIEKKFYRHLADLTVEILKMTHMSKKEQIRRYTYTNLDIINKLKENKRDIIAVVAHYNNWEWPTLLPDFTKYKTIIIYKPLQNKYFNNSMNNQRSKFGIVLTPTSHVIRDIIENKRKQINTLSVFISDQIPARGDIKYWSTFLNQDTAVYTGAGKIAAKYDMAMIYFNIQKVKRGYYNLNVELLHEHTAGFSEEDLTETHVKRLDEIIREKPEFWIWSHRRWKHKKPAENV
jgi:Kdo2-lipid IVA lauroyltransferase/acyltransferase